MWNNFIILHNYSVWKRCPKLTVVSHNAYIIWIRLVKSSCLLRISNMWIFKSFVPRKRTRFRNGTYRILKCGSFRRVAPKNNKPHSISDQLEVENLQEMHTKAIKSGSCTLLRIQIPLALQPLLWNYIKYL